MLGLNFQGEPRRRRGRRRAYLRLHRNEPLGDHSWSTYPDSSELVSRFADLHDIPTTTVTAVAGADQGLDVVCRAVGAGKAVALEPEFERYGTHAENAGLTLERVPVHLDTNNFEFPTAELLSAVDESTVLVILSVVGNPTGVVPPLNIVEQLRKRAPNVLILLDSVYAPFIGLDFCRVASRTPGVIALHSLSKLGWPGLRVGFLVAEPSTLKRLTRFVSPAAVASPSIALALGRLADKATWRGIVLRQMQARTYLAARLAERGFRIAHPAGNWVLFRAGPAAMHLVEELKPQMILVQHPQHPDLSEWVRVSTPSINAAEDFVNALDELLDGPVRVRSGLLSFESDPPNPRRLADFRFLAMLQGELVKIDHLVVVRPAAKAGTKFVNGLLKAGGRLIEGPGVWPVQFCDPADPDPDLQLALANQDLWMNLTTVLMPAGGLVVVSSPAGPGDQISRFIESRGGDAVHHVAIRVDDLDQAAAYWAQRGYVPFSRRVDDGTLGQWFLHNSQGQILELIRRHRDGRETFTCANIAGLRRSEAA